MKILRGQGNSTLGSEVTHNSSISFIKITQRHYIISLIRNVKKNNQKFKKKTTLLVK